jgi:Mesyanzhinovviridae DNA polymerase
VTQQQISLFKHTIEAKRAHWKPAPPPSLRALGVKKIAMDTEGTGLRWYAGDLPIGISYCLPDGTTGYLPWGHTGGNLDEGAVKRWAKRELRDIHINFLNGPFDINNIYMWGVDLEAQGCTVSDVGHHAALLDDHRTSSSLDSVARDYGVGQKLDGPDKTRMREYHAGDVEEYARHDSLLVHLIEQKTTPLIYEQGLQNVLQVENECLYATCEMERNGAPLDGEKLERWLAQSEREYIETLYAIHRMTGININPASTNDLRRVFRKCGIDVPRINMPGPTYGKETFDKHYLESIEHPAVRLIRRAKRLLSVRTKYLIPYWEEYKKFGMLRYALNQLRVSDDEEQGEVGTISGRYSSSAYSTGDGKNIQQVAGKKHQHSVKEEEDWPYKPRELIIPEAGRMGCSADADQIEYRLFAHYAKPEKILAEYDKDPKTNFHRVVHAMISKYREITYELTKDCNFAGLYGAGLKKWAYMLGMDPESESTQKLYRTYHNTVPEIRALLKKAMRIAESRGYVKTMLGRRARFREDDRDRLHASLNRVIQGSAADEMKLKLVALRKAKTGMKLRFTVHDEVYGDVASERVAQKVSKVLNTQILKTRVPLLWTVKTGPNWNECKKAA